MVVIIDLTSHGLQASLLIVDLQDLGNIVIDTVAVVVLVMSRNVKTYETNTKLTSLTL